ncbi:MAG: hypothetical protein ACI9AP_001374, partial [Flavobacteriales bacterium]
VPKFFCDAALSIKQASSELKFLAYWKMILLYDLMAFSSTAAL